VRRLSDSSGPSPLLTRFPSTVKTSISLLSSTSQATAPDPFPRRFDPFWCFVFLGGVKFFPGKGAWRLRQLCLPTPRFLFSYSIGPFPFPFKAFSPTFRPLEIPSKSFLLSDRRAGPTTFFRLAGRCEVPRIRLRRNRLLSWLSLCGVHCPRVANMSRFPFFLVFPHPAGVFTHPRNDRFPEVAFWQFSHPYPKTGRFPFCNLNRLPLPSFFDDPLLPPNSPPFFQSPTLRSAWRPFRGLPPSLCLQSRRIPRPNLSRTWAPLARQFSGPPPAPAFVLVTPGFPGEPLQTC